MSEILDRIHNDIQQLVEQVTEIQNVIRKGFGSVMEFSVIYEPWYAKARRAVRFAAPERLEDFDRCYRNSDRLALSNYSLSNFVAQSWPMNSKASEVVNRTLVAFNTQLSILLSASQLLGSVLADLSKELRAEILDADIESAVALADARLFRCAGVIAGVVLETHLRAVCAAHGIELSVDRPTLGLLNDTLKKVEVIDHITWRQVQGLGDIRNKCAHANGSEPTEEEVRDLIEGVKRKIKQIF